MFNLICYVIGMFGLMGWCTYLSEAHPDQKFAIAMFFITGVVVFTAMYVTYDKKFKDEKENHG